MQPCPGVHAQLLADGRLELRAPDAETLLVCRGPEAAMWIALRRADWDIGSAALALARAVDADPWAVRDAMRDWTAELVAAGVVGA